MLLDLGQIAKEFVQFHLSSCEESVADAAVVQAISDSAVPRTERERVLLNWLNRYKVLLFFPPESSRAISASIIDFADERHNATEALSKCGVVAEYEKMANFIRRSTPVNPKTGSLRKVQSLSSKALWCCYPNDVPLWDDYASRALQVVSRLAGIKPESTGQDYACFVDVWFQVYEKVKPSLDDADPVEHPYAVRTFDKFLWYLGQPRFL